MTWVPLLESRDERRESIPQNCRLPFPHMHLGTCASMYYTCHNRHVRASPNVTRRNSSVPYALWALRMLTLQVRSCLKKKQANHWVFWPWWPMPVILALGRWKQEYCEFWIHLNQNHEIWKIAKNKVQIQSKVTRECYFRRILGKMEYCSGFAKPRSKGCPERSPAINSQTLGIEQAF